jgi:hypothetical protein
MVNKLLEHYQYLAAEGSSYEPYVWQIIYHVIQTIDFNSSLSEMEKSIEYSLLYSEKRTSFLLPHGVLIKRFIAKWKDSAEPEFGGYEQLESESVLNIVIKFSSQESDKYLFIEMLCYNPTDLVV